jgi:hypothetical protein
MVTDVSKDLFCAHIPGAVAVAACGPVGHVVVRADIFFEKEEDTKEYNKYLQAYVTAVHKNSYNDLQSFQPYNTPPVQP